MRFSSLMLALFLFSTTTQAQMANYAVGQPCSPNDAAAFIGFPTRVLNCNAGTWENWSPAVGGPASLPIDADGVAADKRIIDINGNGDPFLGFFGVRNLYAGEQSGKALETSSGFYNTLFGSAAGAGITTGNANTIVGAEAGRLVTTAGGNTFFGSQAGRDTTTGGSNVFIGSQTGTNNTTGSNNVYIGQQAGELGTTSDSNIAIGIFAGSDLTGQSNVLIGRQAGMNITSGESNVFIGRSAGETLTTSNENIAVGTGAGAAITTGARNIYIGHQAGTSRTTGITNVMIGYLAGGFQSGGSGNVFLGAYAGTDENGSDKLYIDNSGTTTPLIYGDFSTDRVGINTATPQSALSIPDGQYLQAEDNNAGAPPGADCDANNERGRLSIDTTNNRLYVCNGATRGWDYVALTN